MEEYWIWLNSLKHIGPVTQKLLLKHFKNPKNIFEATFEELQVLPTLKKKTISSIINNRNLNQAVKIMKKVKLTNSKLLCWDDALYPSFVKKSKYSPTLLYYKGTIKSIETSVGVVGSRRSSEYGKRIACQIGESLAFHEIPVISGFAKGIDTYVQASSFNNGGYTIGILGCGVDICYPKEQTHLYNQILEKGGAFLSSYPPGTPPVPKQFVQRNSIISAWSQKLIVVEAGTKSGALLTADFALNEKKVVFAVPHPIYTPDGEGTNLLLEKGAKPFLGVHSLQLPIPASKYIPTLHISHEERTIINEVSKSPKSISYLINILNIKEEQLIELLMNLEWSGYVIIRGNKVYHY